MGCGASKSTKVAERNKTKSNVEETTHRDPQVPNKAVDTTTENQESSPAKTPSKNDPNAVMPMTPVKTPAANSAANDDADNNNDINNKNSNVMECVSIADDENGGGVGVGVGGNESNIVAHAGKPGSGLAQPMTPSSPKGVASPVNPGNRRVLAPIGAPSQGTLAQRRAAPSSLSSLPPIAGASPAKSKLAPLAPITTTAFAEKKMDAPVDKTMEVGPVSPAGKSENRHLDFEDKEHISEIGLGGGSKIAMFE